MRIRPVLSTALAALLISLAVPGAAVTNTAPASPRRIVSLNLCADQYLLALADPGQIAALTRFARDPQMSAGARRAAGVPMTRGAAEDVLAIDPDLIVASPGRRTGVRAALKGRYPVLELPPAENYDEIVAHVRTVARAVGHPERGEALIQRMDAALAGVKRDAGGGRVAAYYQRRGYLTGTGTLVDDLMRRVGLANLATRLDRPPLSRLSLEQLVAARPHFLIVETATDRVTDQGTEMLHHPVTDGIPRLRLPQAWTVCGGPAYVLAARSLVAQLDKQK